MARVEIHGERIIIRLTPAEKLAAMHRRDITLSRDAISSAIITDDPWVWIRGVRSPGTHVPGKLALGTWRSLGGRDFVLARAGRDAVVLDFEPREGALEDRGWVGEFENYSRVIISTVHAAELVRALRLDGPQETVVTVDTAP